MTPSSYESLRHAKWDGKITWSCIPQGRKNALYGKSRGLHGPVWHALARPRGSTIVARPRVQDHVHLRIRMPPKYAVAEVMGESKGKRAIAVARQWGGRPRTLHEERCGVRGYAVSPVGCEAEPRRAVSKPQEQLDAQGSDESGEC
jgi:putative transposase